MLWEGDLSMEGKKVVNCWEHTNCTSKESCPAFPKPGWQCWNIAGTLWRGERQGDYQEKVHQCRHKCDFYRDMMSGKILAS